MKVSKGPIQKFGLGELLVELRPIAYERNMFGCRRQIGKASDQPKVGS